jgi:hypothetical protein
LIRLNIDFGEMHLLEKHITKYSSQLPKENAKMLTELGNFIVDRSQGLAPRFLGNLSAGIKLEKINDKSIRIASTARNPFTGEAYGYVQETGDYSKSSKRLPLTYAGMKYGFSQAHIAYLRLWAQNKAPQLLENKVKWITPKGYKPHIEPAFREGIRKAEELINNAHARAVKDSGLR